MPTILIGGDICPIGDNAPFFRGGDAGALFHDLLPEFNAADLVIANLECPLIRQPSPIAKMGPVFGEDITAINGIRAAGIDVLCLANNHILDHGPPGLESTLGACRRAGIETVGAGPDLSAARRVLVRTIGATRIGVLAMAEHEFSIATESSAGANPLDVIDYVRTVSHARNTLDYLVVLVHGGPEFLTAPTPRLKKLCHFLVETGANAVIVQHPHSLGGYEEYLGAHIVYGQGALVMDEAIYRDRQAFHQGVLVALTVAKDNASSSMTLIPFVQSDPAPGARRMGTRESATFLEELADKSRHILDDSYLARAWTSFCEENKHQYLSVLFGHSRLLRVANRRGHLARLLYNRHRMLGTRNVVCCETHREALETILARSTV